ncbi:MAG: hypothetical protein FWG14_06535 [Peptococcaceae bacterium]|nr:hypothetical protein [Peptococcaceae bacterium]
MTDAQGNTTSYTYDKTGNKLSEKDPLGRVTKYVYDKLSRVTSIADPRAGITDLLSNFLPIFDTHTEKFAYDAQSRIISVTDKNKNTTHYAYDANDNIISTIDANGTQTRYEYDAMNQLTKIILNRIDPQANINETQITLYKYDKRGLRIQTIDPQNNTITNTYDEAGNLIQTIDADNFTTQTTYDPRNLIESINTYAQNSTTPDKTTQYTYDEEGNLTQNDDWTGQTSFEYDLLAQLTKVIDQNTQTTQYTYDPVGNQTQITYPDTSTVTKTYDSLSQLIKVTNAPANASKTQQKKPEETTYTYNQAQEHTSTTYPNGIKEDRTYDKAGQLIKIHEKKKLKYEYAYDPHGNIIKETKSKIGLQPAESNTFAYDRLNRLVSSTDSKTKIETTYTYDTLGNLTQEISQKSKDQDITTYTYNKLNQQITKHEKEIKSKKETDKDTHHNTFDKRGNLIKTIKQGDPTLKKPTQDTTTAQYTYDSTNRMIEGINEKNELSEYHYNSLGALIGETKLIAKDAYSYTGVDAQPTQSKRDPKYQKDKTSLIETQNTIDYTSELLDKLTETEQGGLTYKYVYGLDKLSVDISPTPPETTAATKTTKTTTPPAPTLYYYHQDRQGSIDSLTDNCACVKSSAGYDPWGKPKKSDPLKEGKRKLDLVTEYTTYAYDNVLNIYHAKARMYDAENRRFMAQDMVTGFQQNPQTLVRDPFTANITHSQKFVYNGSVDTSKKAKVNRNIIYGDNPQEMGNSLVPNIYAILQSSNLYVYCVNNPVRFIDPSGYGIEEIDWEATAKGTTRALARLLIGNPINNFVTKHGGLKELFDLAGFVRTKDQQGTYIYHARQDCLQQYGGYNSFYDMVFDYGTSMDRKFFQFTSGGKEYRLWAWKGDYLNLGAGAEMGIYKQAMEGSDIHWLVDQSLAMHMTLTLKLDGKTIIEWDPAKDKDYPSDKVWWVTGFNPYITNVDASRLEAIYTVTFNTQTMYTDFYKKFGDKNSDDYDPRWTFDPKTNTATLRF